MENSENPVKKKAGSKTTDTMGDILSTNTVFSEYTSEVKAHEVHF